MGPLLRAFSHRPFTLLWSGQTVSRLGDHVYRLALAWWVLEKTGSAVVMGTVLICSTLPLLLFSLLGGALVDRWPRLRTMLASDVLRGLAVGLIAALALGDQLAPWHIYVISTIFGVLDAFFLPAYRASIPELLAPELLTSANSLNSLSGEASGLIGPAIGAGLVAVGGTSIAFAVDALSFFVSAACLLPILRLTRSPAASAARPGILQEVRLGLRTVFSLPWVWITIAVAGISNITHAAPMGVALPFLIRDHLHADVALLGFFYTSMSLGAILGASWLGRFASLRRRGMKLYGVWMLVGLMVAALALPLTVPLVLIAALVIGAANTLLGLIWVNALQQRIPRDLQGRVASVDYLGSSLLEPVGYGIGGWATGLLGPVAVFAAGGLLQTGLISLGLLHPDVRALD